MDHFPHPEIFFPICLKKLPRRFWASIHIYGACLLMGIFLVSKRNFLLQNTQKNGFSFFSGESSLPKVKFEWQEIFTDFFVYSIYPSPNNKFPELHATIIASAVNDSFWVTTTCRCVYHSNDKKLPEFVLRSQLDQLPEAHRDELRNITAGRIRCHFPDYVQKCSHVDLRCKCNKLNLSGKVTLPVPVSLEDRQPPASLSFAHCGPPIFGDFDRPATIIEFVEYYRLMGVSKFYWYEVDVSNRTKRVLDYYEREGLMDVTKWSIPESIGDRIHYFGQLAILYDCLLKSTLTHDYTVFSDLDEFFATTKEPATFANIVNNGVLDCSLIRSAFMDPNVNYTDRFDSHSGKPILQTSTIKIRDSFVFWSKTRSKYICRGRFVDLPRIHFVKTFKGHPTVGHPQPEKNIVLHFRSNGQLTLSTTKETRAAAHDDILDRHTSTVWNNIFGLQKGIPVIAKDTTV